MIEKIIELAKSLDAFKRVCIFLTAFVATVAIMGGNHEIFYGSSVTEESKEVQPSQSSAVPQESLKNDTTVTVGLEGREFAKGLMHVSVKAPKLEEINTNDSEKKKLESGDAKSEGKAMKEGTKDSSEDNEVSSSPAKEKTEESEAPEGSGFKYFEEIPMSRELQEYTYQKCEDNGIEYELVLAIIWRESGFNVDAVNINTNGTRDNGIMQINDINRQWLLDSYGITDLMDPYQNIDAGTSMLGRLTKKYGSHNAMLAYQYGEVGMSKKLKQGITTSTAIEKAYKQRDHYREILV